jgi:hypothetical protein
LQPPSVEQLVVVVNIFTNRGTFQQVHDAYVRLVDDRPGSYHDVEMARYKLDANIPTNGLIFAALHRVKPEHGAPVCFFAFAEVTLACLLACGCPALWLERTCLIALAARVCVGGGWKIKAVGEGANARVATSKAFHEAVVGLRKTELIRRRSSRGGGGGGGGMAAAAAAVAAPNIVAVVCPAGVSAGQPMLVTGPSGRQYQVAVPAGVSPGQQFQIMLPS